MSRGRKYFHHRVNDSRDSFFKETAPGIFPATRDRDYIPIFQPYHLPPLLPGVTPMKPVLSTIALLMVSNVFMTFAWYAHLKELSNKPWIVAALVSWGVALLEYLFQVPANRIGYTVFDFGQLKILQEVITLSVFVPFAFFYLREPLKLDYLWAALCMMGAVYFIFRAKLGVA